MASGGGDDAISDVDRFEFCLLLEQFKKSLELLFSSGDADNNIEISLDESLLEPVFTACNSVMLHHLQIYNEVNLNPSTCAGANFEKLRDDFEFILKSASFHHAAAPENTMNFDCSNVITSNASITALSIEKYFHSWILRNFKSKCLCVAIKELVSDNELLNIYYGKCAFLRNEKYAAAFCVGLSALELNQSSLLSQIDCELYTAHRHSSTTAVTNSVRSIKHKRQSSHPNFSLNPVAADSHPPDHVDSAVASKTLRKRPYSVRQYSVETKALPLFRKVKSLPHLPTVIHQCDATSSESPMRERSKTVGANSKLLSETSRWQCAENQKSSKLLACKASPSCKIDLTELPSTSASSCNSSQSRNSQMSNPVEESRVVVGNQIEIINCDDIKIWTEQDAMEAAPLYALPIQKSKSISPINGFLSSLFGTPPTYSEWYKNAQITESDEALGGGHYPCNTKSYYENSSCGMGFLPVYGKKLENRQKSSVFEDGISTLDYSASTSTPIKTNQITKLNQTSALTNLKSIEKDKEKTPTTKKNLEDKAGLKSNQSLTTFLQASQVSQGLNDTDLEKENAHFRISEAIITAIEHLKCRKQQNTASSTATATDWLAKDHENQSQGGENLKKTVLFELSSDENVPYVDGPDECCEELSAEVIGLSLISKFNEKHLPTISELKYLVSEEDAPQQLLPIPDLSGTSNPDENVIPSVTRGTKYWAPPRQQIIFTDHPTPNRKEQIIKQNYRCSGCGMRIHSQYMNSFRYCTYFGKYHCTGCHRNQMSAIPAKILNSWDFKCYPVSAFAYRLLEQLYTFPVFHVPDLSPALYVKSKALLNARSKRLQLKFIKDFVMSCRFAVREQKYFNSIPEHITNDIDIWSMSDFVDAHNESMQRSIDDLVLKCENHIQHCVLCNGRGFICEYCQRDQILFPWNNKKVFRCDRCGACFHVNCWKTMSETCCRCQRIYKRQEISFIENEDENVNPNSDNNRNNNLQHHRHHHHHHHHHHSSSISSCVHK